MAAMKVLAASLDELDLAFGSEEMGADVGGHMTCREANVFAAVLKYSLHAEGALLFLVGHAEEDSEGDDHYDADMAVGAFEDRLAAGRKYLAGL